MYFLNLALLVDKLFNCVWMLDVIPFKYPNCILVIDEAAKCGISESSLNGQIVSFYMEEFGNWQSGLNMMLDLRNGVLEIMCNDTSILHANNDTGAVSHVAYFLPPYEVIQFKFFKVIIGDVYFLNLALFYDFIKRL